MYRATRFFLFCLFIISIIAAPEKKKTCIHNLIINGTNLLASHRKQLLIVGITNFNNQSSRIQANRYYSLILNIKGKKNIFLIYCLV